MTGVRGVLGSKGAGVGSHSTILCCLDLADVSPRAQLKAGSSFTTLGLDADCSAHPQLAVCHCLASTSASLEIGGSELLGLLILRAGDSLEEGTFLRRPEALHVWLLLGLASRGLWFATQGDSEFYSTRGQPEATGTPWGQDVMM